MHEPLHGSDFAEHTLADRGLADTSAAELLRYRSVVLSLAATLSFAEALFESLL